MVDFIKLLLPGQYQRDGFLCYSLQSGSHLSENHAQVDIRKLNVLQFLSGVHLNDASSLFFTGSSFMGPHL